VCHGVGRSEVVYASPPVPGISAPVAVMASPETTRRRPSRGGGMATSFGRIIGEMAGATVGCEVQRARQALRAKWVIRSPCQYARPRDRDRAGAAAAGHISRNSYRSTSSALQAFASAI
jgi:hypothetical protein